MPDVSKIRIDSNEYDVCDDTARSLAASANAGVSIVAENAQAIGNSVGGNRWNQLCRPYSITPTEHAGISITGFANGCYIINGTSTNGMYLALAVSLKAGHKYYMTLRSNQPGLPQPVLSNGRSSYVNPNEDMLYTVDSEDPLDHMIIYIGSGITFDNTIILPIISDLTEACGDLVPSTIEEFHLKFGTGTFWKYYPIGGFHSNKNFLDNSFFSVNSRGLSSYGGGYTVDRWFIYGGASLYVYPTGINLVHDSTTNLSFLNQYLTIDDARELAGKEVTLSIEVAETRLVKKITFRCPTNLNTVWDTPGIIYNDWIIDLYGNPSDSDNKLGIRFFTNIANANIAVRAIKLEIGDDSTIECDTIPNYADELTRCVLAACDPTDDYSNLKTLFSKFYSGGGGYHGFSDYAYYAAASSDLTSRLRNSGISGTDAYPSANGEIVWKYQ